MPLSFKPFSAIDAADLARLQANAIPEGLRVDYKRDYYASGEGKEFLKDLSSFANSHGGYLIIGAEEENGIIKSLPGVSSSKIDDEIQRMENWARDGIEPRIVGIQMRRVDLSEGTAAVIIFLPKSMNPPHRVSSQNTNRFFVRNSNGKHEASVEELRQLFGFSARLSDEIQRFVQVRRAQIAAGADTVPDFGEGRLITHVINAATFGDKSFVDVKRLHPDPYRFAPNSSGGLTRRMTLEGVLVGSEAEGKFWDRTLIGRDGIIETVFSKLYHTPKEQTLIGGLGLTENLLSSVEIGLKGLLSLGASGPFIIAIALQISKGMPIAFYNDSFNRYPKFDRDFVELPVQTIFEYDNTISTPHLIRPILDSLWNSVGLSECGYFHNNEWRLPR